jgi:hypothetical protein
MGCAQPDDRGWRPRARPCWEHGMVAGLTSNHHPNPLPPEGSRPADAGNSDGTPFDLPQVQLSSLIGIHSVLLRLRRRSMGRFTHWGRAKRVLPPA